MIYPKVRNLPIIFLRSFENVGLDAFFIKTAIRLCLIIIANILCSCLTLTFCKPSVHNCSYIVFPLCVSLLSSSKLCTTSCDLSNGTINEFVCICIVCMIHV